MVMNVAAERGDGAGALSAPTCIYIAPAPQSITAKPNTFIVPSHDVWEFRAGSVFRASEALCFD